MSRSQRKETPVVNVNGETIANIDGEIVRLVPITYVGGNPGVRLETVDGQPYATLSVNLPGETLPEGSFFLKDWSENRDLARALIAQGVIVIDETVDPVPSGHVMVRAFRIA